MQGLQTLINQLEKGRGLHICVLDLNGILNTELMQVEFKNSIHSKGFCDVAKSTDKGIAACLRCKMMANSKAVNSKTPFFGHCFYGLYEVAYPVIISGEAYAVVYVGNALIDESAARARINKMSARTGVDSDALLAHLSECERFDTDDELFSIAEIVSDYIKLLYERAPREQNKLHWMVSLLKRHADERYFTDVSLKEIALTYRKNEKYIGRIFKEQIGMSFCEYCNELRMKRAEELLLRSDSKIIDIAFECGFNSVSYFNKQFYKRYGMPPGVYKKEKIKK